LKVCTENTKITERKKKTFQFCIDNAKIIIRYKSGKHKSELLK